MCAFKRNPTKTTSTAASYLYWHSSAVKTKWKETMLSHQSVEAYCKLQHNTSIGKRSSGDLTQ